MDHNTCSALLSVLNHNVTRTQVSYDNLVTAVLELYGLAELPPVAASEFFKGDPFAKMMIAIINGERNLAIYHLKRTAPYNLN